MKNKQIKLSGYNQIANEQIQSLTLLYAPLIGIDAIQFYLLLVSLVNSNMTNYTLLTLLMQKTYEEIDYYRELLEEYKLLRTYKTQENDIYYLDVQVPLSGLAFLTHMLYSRIYHAKLKDKVFRFMLEHFEKKNNFEELEEITKYLNLGKEIGMLELESENYDEVTIFGIQHQFDYATFIKYQEQYLIPNEIVQNEKLLQKIGEYASIYNVDAKTMAKLVARSTILANKTLNFEKLVYYLSEVKLPTIDENSNVQHPLQYLKMKQKGIEPNRYERKLIEKLITEYRLSYELINLLLEHSLEKNENRIIEKYIETIASTWVRKEIKTVEQAIKELQPKAKKVSRKAKMIASWQQKTSVDTVDEAELLELLTKGEK